jgi:hypothetical protein
MSEGWPFVAFRYIGATRQSRVTLVTLMNHETWPLSLPVLR